MNSYTIAEEYTLPSGGLIYTQKVNPRVKLKSMTTEDEMKRLSPSDRIYKNLCEIIDSCMVEDIGISSYDMCLADYQFLLHKLRVVTYGPEYEATTICPVCSTPHTQIINLNELNVKDFNKDLFMKYSEFTLPKTGKKIKIKLQTPRMVDDINERAEEIRRKSNNSNTGAAFSLTIQSWIDTVDGKQLDPVEKENFVRALPMMDTNYIIKHAEKLVESFGLEVSLSKKCPVCGERYDSSFRITKEFFGPSIDI